MNAFNFFNHIYCLNIPKLKHSDTRKQNMILEFKKVNIVDRVDFSIYAELPWENFKSNIHDAVGDFGNTLSHLKIILDSLKYDGHILIFEDDCKFHINTHEILNAAINELPDTWEILYLGGRPKNSLSFYSENLAKTNWFLNCMSYAIHKDSKIKLLNYFFDNMGKIYPYSHTDNIVSSYAEQNKSGFCLTNRVTFPIPGPSLVKGGNKCWDYTNLQKVAWDKYLPERNKK